MKQRDPAGDRRDRVPTGRCCGGGGVAKFLEAAAKLRGCRARTGLTGEQGGSNKPSCSDEENIWHCLSRLLGPAPQASHFFNLAVQPDR